MLAARSSSDLDYLFVVTYGRSGSTLLQGILNSIPGYLIRGENHQVMRHLFEADRDLRRARTKHRRWLRRSGRGESLSPAHPWFGVEHYPRRKALRLARRYAEMTLMRPEPGTRVTGFKEIRWSSPDLPEFVEWLRVVFPGARFVINTRNLDAVVRSGWWRKDPGARAKLEVAEERLLALATDLGDVAHHLHYDDYVKDPSLLAGLFAWLGEEYDAQRLADVMNTPHSWPYVDHG